MRYKLLGPSGLRASELCLGTMSFGDAWGFGADETESHRILAAYAEAGGNFIDTANKYHEGQSEEIVGSFVGAERERWVVASKYTLAMRSGDPNAAGNSRKNMRQSVEARLRRLRTDYLDLLWVHAWDYATPVEEVMRGLDDLVRADQVTYVALSDAPAWVASQANTLATLRGWSPVRRPAVRVQPDRAHGGARASAGRGVVRPLGQHLGADGRRCAHWQVHPRLLRNSGGQ